MIIKDLEIRDFRNIRELKTEPTDEINVIYGDNAQGKTNLLEAIWLFCGLKSFRTSKDSELIRIGAEKAVIKSSFFAENRDQEAKITIEKARSAELNGIKLKSCTELCSKFQAVIFSPQDLELISQGPAERRHFTDTVICQLYPSYNNKLKRYQRAVEQRNFVLKDFRTHPELDVLLDDFEAEIVKAGSEIIKYRIRFCEKLALYGPEIFCGLSKGKESFEIKYVSTAGNSSAEFILKLKESREQDSFNLSTSVGPHRDDLEILINGLSARKFASQGQKRSAAITLKLSEGKIIEDVVGTRPIILLDDVMSELDRSRQSYILNHIKGMQVFITCCDPGNIEELEKGRVIKLSGGRIE